MQRGEQGVRLEPLLGAISDFLKDQEEKSPEVVAAD